MRLMNKLERKLGRFAIHNLIYYVIVIYIAGFVLDLIDNSIYTNWLSLDVYQILHGQVWRIVTFMLQPPSESIIFFLIELLLYFSIGQSLEAMWGSFRFNVFFFSGVLFQIIAAFLFYGIVTLSYGIGLPYITIGIGSLYYVNRSMFLAYIAMVPNAEFRLYFVLPIKAKWLGIFYGALMGYEMLSNLFRGIREKNLIYIALAVAVVVSVANFLIFFFTSRSYSRIAPSEIKRRTEFRRKMRNAEQNAGTVVEFRGRNVMTKHKCAVCGRTELDDDSLEFRFCSKCDGNYEYCSDHLYTHVHVKKEQNENS